MKRSNLHQDIQNKVYKHLKNSGNSIFANKFMMAKSVFILMLVSIFYLSILNCKTPLNLCLLWIGLGLACGLVGVNIGHDALHGAFSKYSSVNKILGSVFTLLGISTYLWDIQHNKVHHTFTNINTLDRDLSPAGRLLRLSPHQKYFSFHSWQIFYLIPAYSLAIINWVFVKDFVLLFGPRIGAHIWKSRPSLEIAKVLLCKFIYLGLFLGIPLYMVDLPALHVLAAWFVGTLVEGLFVAILFMVAHATPKAHFYQAHEAKPSWFERQILTSSTFSPGNKIVNFICGGLNFQIEHHLFPGICHVHYPQIAPIVKEEVLKAGLFYNEHSGFISAFLSHFKFIHHLGKKP